MKLFHLVLAYTREATARKGPDGPYTSEPTAAYKLYAEINADHLIEAARSGTYEQVVCICPGTIQIPERGMQTDGEILRDAIMDELMLRTRGDEFVRQRIDVVVAPQSSCDTRTDVMRFKETALLYCLRSDWSTDLRNPDEYVVTMACDGSRTDRSVQALRYHFGFLCFPEENILDAVSFVEGQGGRIKQRVYRWVDALGYATPAIYQKQYRKRLWEIRQDGLVYEPGYDLVSMEGVLN